MPKRDVASDDSLSPSSDEEPVAKKAKEEVRKPVVKSEEPKRKSKKEKKQSGQSSGDSDDSFDDVSSSGLEPGAFWIDEKRMRRIQVREFKGKPLIDIREMYQGKQGLAPGKKGISLNIPEWRKLCKMISVVDKEIEKIT